MGSNSFSAFTQDNATSWEVDELYFTIFFSINGGYLGVAGEACDGVFLSLGRC